MGKLIDLYYKAAQSDEPGAFIVLTFFIVMPAIFIPMGFGLYFIGHLIGIPGW